MAQRKQEPTDTTSKGYKVRAPKRSEFFQNLKKIAGVRPSPLRHPKK